MRTCLDCVTSLEGTHHSRKRCKSCSVIAYRAGSKKSYEKNMWEGVDKLCFDCGAPIPRRTKRCQSCKELAKKRLKSEQGKRHYARHQIEVDEKNKRWVTENRERAKAISRLAARKKSGCINPTDELKSGPCEICNNIFDVLHFDHCHKTGLFRGWLCAECNKAIGLFYEDRQRLLNAVTYLDKPLVQNVNT
jgi:hypothetical protein